MLQLSGESLCTPVAVGACVGCERMVICLWVGLGHFEKKLLKFILDFC